MTTLDAHEEANEMKIFKERLIRILNDWSKEDDVSKLKLFEIEKNRRSLPSDVQFSGFYRNRMVSCF
mgnify:FL=1